MTIHSTVQRISRTNRHYLSRALLSLLAIACSSAMAAQMPTDGGGAAALATQPVADGGSAAELSPDRLSALGGVYLGSIGNIPIQATLSVTGSTLQGSYFYQRIGKPLSLIGNITAPCMLEFDESDPSTSSGAKGVAVPTGRFRGTCESSAHTIHGQWSTPDGKRHLPFILRQLATLHPVTVQGKGVAAQARLETSYPEFLPSTGALGVFASEQLAVEVRNQVEAFHQDFDSTQEPSDFEMTTSYQVAFYSDALISIRVLTTNEQTGGHSQSGYTSRLFTMGSQGPRVGTVEDVLASPVSKSVSRLETLGERLLEKNGHGPEHPRLIPVLRSEDFALTVTARGLELYYVFPPSDGTPLPLLVPYGQLKSIVSSTGVLRSLLK